MASDRFDDAGDDFDDRPRRRDDRRGGGRAADARARTSAPGLLLALAAGVALALSGLGLVVGVVKPSAISDPIFDFYINTLQAQPPSPQRDDALAKLREEKAKGQAVNPVNVGLSGLAAAFNLVSLMAGLKMRALSGYGLSLTGAILACVPVISGCCCLTMPVGLWALITLLNPDVKAAFDRPSRAAAGGDDL